MDILNLWSQRIVNSVLCLLCTDVLVLFVLLLEIPFGSVATVWQTQPQQTHIAV